MNIETIESSAFSAILIKDVDRLDPITVIFQDFNPGVGRIVVECYGESWASWWGAMGERNVREFVARCDDDYLSRNLIRARRKPVKADEEYIRRISSAIINALKAA